MIIVQPLCYMFDTDLALQMNPTSIPLITARKRNLRRGVGPPPVFCLQGDLPPVVLYPVWSASRIRGGGGVCLRGIHGILRDTVNKRVVHILLECTLVHRDVLRCRFLVVGFAAHGRTYLQHASAGPDCDRYDVNTLFFFKVTVETAFSLSTHQ